MKELESKQIDYCFVNCHSCPVLWYGINSGRSESTRTENPVLLINSLVTRLRGDDNNIDLSWTALEGEKQPDFRIRRRLLFL
jgi:hypothetical protein